MKAGGSMTKSQIQNIISDHDISTNTWVKLGSFYKMIFLTQDGNIYPDDKTQYYRFNTTHELLEVVHGKYINRIFYTDAGESDSSKFVADHFIDFALITGFIE